MNTKQLIMAFAVLGLVMSGCSEEVEPRPEGPLLETALGNLEKAEVRSLMHPFADSGRLGVNVKSVLELIRDEGLRFHPDHAWADDFMIENVTFGLASTLPELDMWGDQDATGGYSWNTEVVHDDEGDVSSEIEVAHVVREFTEGAISGFSYMDVKQNADPLAVNEEHRWSCTFATPALYKEWETHEQVAYKRSNTAPFSHEEQHAYQKHATMGLAILAGSHHTHVETTADLIQTQSGWTVLEEERDTTKLNGGLTRFRPSVANAASVDALEDSFPDESEVDEGVTRIVTQQWTTVDESENPTGPAGAVLETRRSVTDHVTVNTYHVLTGDLLKSASDETTTVHVAYDLLNGAGIAALSNHSLEGYANHVETVRNVHLLENAFEGMNVDAVNGPDLVNQDFDGDGINDDVEIANGTDPEKSDSDGDGLDDGVEILLGWDPLNDDMDDDGLLDPEEAAHGTDPHNADTDGDGLTDGEEVAQGTNPMNADTDFDGVPDGADNTPGEGSWAESGDFFADSDGDHVVDFIEWEKGTSMEDADSDGDGLGDGVELLNGTNPLTPWTDEDGWNDYVEILHGTDPTNPDTDGDGVLDGAQKSEDESTQVYRHTDNPATRNDIGAWKSTSTTREKSWFDPVTWVEFHYGTEWLLDQIEVDPDYDAVSFGWSGTEGETSLEEVVYFGDDADAFEQQTYTTGDFAYSASWGTSNMSIDGNFDELTATIDNGAGKSHSNGGNASGVVGITLNGASTQWIDIEEWRDTVEP